MLKPAEERDEEQLAALLAELREPPRSWIEAAKELPSTRAGIDQIIGRANADESYRAELLADLEEALASEGHEPTPQRIAALRAGLEASGSND